ncbi:MAG: Aminopyrimidine aminohydrolase [Alphaproteobacteria bacterium MarineAlpha11_Bin1]|nr:MAG: Aminopyrimidine aminohydrolase [Alphaproteobacteria bacterium MarineAlpha11_Bin1]|tara:strand:+ start:3373 stop:4047 length:675 start_codon:yes stop_codon:yes gene_type:complete
MTVQDNSLFHRLKIVCSDDWQQYVGHDFVRQLADGSLPENSFRHYLIQDYLFLIQFSRAWALAAFKADNLVEIRSATTSLSGIVDVEMDLHVRYCKDWGLTEAEMESAPEAIETTAYTRYVFERGMAGDLLDLHVALAPCIVGYGEIGTALASDRSTVMEGNPYRSWIEMYAGDEYQGVASGAVTQLDRLGKSKGADARFNDLAANFIQATRLEKAFWQMGLNF